MEEEEERNGKVEEYIGRWATVANNLLIGYVLQKLPPVLQSGDSGLVDYHFISVVVTFRSPSPIYTHSPSVKSTFL